MTRQITIPAKTAQEEIACLEEYPNKEVRVRIRVVDSESNEIPTAAQTLFIIKDEQLTELLAPNPSWSPNKPGGTYANDDLWHFIDLIKASNQA